MSQKCTAHPGPNKLPIIYRQMIPADSPFIYSTWLKSYRQMPYAASMSNDTFFHHHKQVVEKILAKPETSVTIICEDTDPDHIYGYSVVEIYGDASIIHYTYIKHSYRKLGLAKTLLQSQIPLLGQKLTFVSHESRHHQAFKSKFALEYNPYII